MVEKRAFLARTVVEKNMNKPRIGTHSASLRLLLGVLALWALASCGEDNTSEGEPSTAGPATPCDTDFDCDITQFCFGGECADMGDECSSATDCDEGLDCLGGFCYEPPVECNEDDECEEDGEICKSNLCIPGCREDDDCEEEGAVCNTDTDQCFVPPPECPDQCPDHTECNEPTGTCVPDGTCDEDDDCTDDLACLNNTCQERPVPCERNADCENNLYCDREDNICLPGCRQANQCRATEVCVDGSCTEDFPECAEDELEPNNEQDNPTPISSGDSYEGLTICSESDWFSFPGFQGDIITVTLDFLNDDGNIDIDLYNTDGDLLHFVAGMNDGEVLMRPLPSNGMYTIEVSGDMRGVFNTYDMLFEIERPCDPDDLEDNDTLEEAIELSQAEISIQNLSLCETDEDWYAIALYPGENLNAEIQFVVGAGDLSLELHNDAQEVVAEGVLDSEAGTVTLSHQSEGEQTLYLKVPGAEGLINFYDLSVSFMPGECTEDDGEEDDTFDQAQEIAPGDSFEGQLCSLDSDWFRIDLPADVPLSAALAFDAQDGSLDLELYDNDGTTLLASSTEEEGVPTVTWTTERPGSHYVRVWGIGRSQNAYTLTVEGGPSVACPDDDEFEDNDDFNSATSLEAGRYGNLIACEDDDVDWYSFTLEEGQSVEVFTLAFGTVDLIDLALFGPDSDEMSDPLTENTQGEAIQRIRAQLGTPPGEYKVRVTRRDDSDVFYSLWLQIYEGRLPLTCDFDDEFEENDIIADAARLEPGQDSEGILCDNNEDWFRFDAEAGKIVSVRIDFEHAQGNLDAYISNANSEQIAIGESIDDGEIFHFAVEQDGPHFLQIVRGEPVEGEEPPDPALGSIYAISVSQIDGPQNVNCAVDDDQEQNDTAATAAVIEPGVLQGALCPNDPDFFGLVLEEGQIVQATVLFTGEQTPTVQAFDPMETMIQEAEENDSSARTLEFMATEAGTYTIGLSGILSSDPPRYTLRVEVFDDSPMLCEEPDEQEPNNDATEAISFTLEEDAVEPMTWVDLTLCGDDEDWFQTTVPRRRILQASASFDPREGDLQMEAFDLDGSGAASSTSGLGLERVELAAEEEDRTVLVRVYRDGEIDNELSYELSMVYVQGTPCTPDENEEPGNNNMGSSVRIAPGTIPNLTICEGDEDWFVFDLPPFQFETARVTAFFEHDNTNLDMELYDAVFPLPNEISNSQTDNETVEVSFALFGGTYFVRVFPNGEGETDYVLLVEIM